MFLYTVTQARPLDFLDFVKNTESRRLPRRVMWGLGEYGAG